MKIAFDGKRAFHNFAGLGNYARNLVEGLQTYYPENEYILYTPPYKDPRIKAWRERFPNVHVKTPSGVMGKIFPSWWRSIFLSKVLDKDRPDIFHGLSHELPPSIHKINIKSVVTVHDLIFIRFPEYFSKVDGQIFHKKMAYCCQSASMIVAICEQTKKDLMEFMKVPEEKIKVLYQTCNPIYYEALSEEKKALTRKKYFLPHKYFLYVGALTERKNLITLVEAYAMSLRYHDIPLVIVGRGDSYKKKLLTRIYELGVEQKIIFLENVETEELPSLYQCATAFLYPSFFEGFGIPIIEALYSGVPVITSTGSCFSESGGPATIYVDPKDRESMARSMIRVLEDQALCQKMISQGKDFVQKFHYKNTSKNMMDFYKSLL